MYLAKPSKTIAYVFPMIAGVALFVGGCGSDTSSSYDSYGSGKGSQPASAQVYQPVQPYTSTLSPRDPNWAGGLGATLDNVDRLAAEAARLEQNSQQHSLQQRGSYSDSGQRVYNQPVQPYTSTLSPRDPNWAGGLGATLDNVDRLAAEAARLEQNSQQHSLQQRGSYSDSGQRVYIDSPLGNEIRNKVNQTEAYLRNSRAASSAISDSIETEAESDALLNRSY